MNFDLSEEQTLLQQTLREFAAREIAPGAAVRDETARFPIELIPKMAALGLLGINIPQNYGGAGLDAVSAAIIIEEIARVDGAIALIVASHNSLCAGHILNFGNQTQKKKYLSSLASGERLGAWALTEPSSGSDAAALRTSAVLNGDHWILNGEKQFITDRKSVV